MTKRIKHVSELPEWFKLEKYEGLRKLSTLSWYVQLIIRKYCLLYDTSAHQDAIDIMREKIFIGLHDNESFVFWYDLLKDIDPYLAILEDHPAVSSLTMRQYFSIEKFLLQERKSYEPEFMDYVLDAVMSRTPDTLHIDLTEERIKCSKLPKQEWLKEPVYKSGTPNTGLEGLVYVNLDFTNDLLVDHFKKWLLDARAKLNSDMTSKLFKQSDFNSWILYGVLPFIDLKIWEKEKKVSIPNRVMADAIYLSGVGGEETVRKTTGPLVQQLLSQKTLNQIAGQFISEFQKIKAEYEKEKIVPEKI